MNAAIRAVTRIGHSKGFNVVGFERGWDGILANNFKKLTPRSVGGIVQLGGTILRTFTCPAFAKPEFKKLKTKNKKKNKIKNLKIHN